MAPAPPSRSRRSSSSRSRAPIVSQPLLDADGNRVISREAEALRDAALMELYTIAPIPSVLDQLVWHFGEERLAEVTGRSKRTIRTANGTLKVVPRSGSANTAESAAFMSGAKEILLFSDAGGTGRSYHAALKAANQRRRRHYLVEPGWRADAAIQGLGRTHRSAQVSRAVVPRRDLGRSRREAVHLDHRAASRHARRAHARPASDRIAEPVPRVGQSRKPDRPSRAHRALPRAGVGSLRGDDLRDVHRLDGAEARQRATA